MMITLDLQCDSANAHAGEVELTESKGDVHEYINLTVYGPERTITVRKDKLLRAVKYI